MSIYTPLIYNGQDVWLNDIPFNHMDDAGNIWTIENLDGWWGLPDIESEEDTRPYTQDGSYFTAGRYPSRNITVTGSIVPHYDSTGGYDPGVLARDLLNSRLGMVRSLGLFRVNENPDKVAVVQLVGRALTKFDKLNNVLKFSFQLKAGDPRKYSVNQLTATSVLSEPDSGRTYRRSYTYTYSGLSTGDNFIVQNDGSYDTGGVFTIRGPVTDPYIEHVDLGRTLRLNTTLGIDDYMTLDLYDRRITLNGTANRKNVLDTRSQWFLIQSGTNTLRYRGSQQIPYSAGTPTISNLLTNPAAIAVGGWVSQELSGSPDYIVSRDQIKVRRQGSVSVAVSGSPASLYFAGSTVTAAIQSVGTLGPRTPVVAEQTYNFSVWVNADAPGISSATMGGDFYDSLGNQISSVLNDISITAVGDNWVRLSTTLSVPVDAVSVNLRTSVSSSIVPGTLGVVVRFADAQLTLGEVLYDYFDGSLSGASWDGTPNQSTSTQSAVPAVPQSVVEFRYRNAWIE